MISYLNSRELRDEVFSPQRTLPRAGRFLFSQIPINSGWMAGGCASLYRSVQDLCETHLKQSGSDSLESIFETFEGRDVAAASNALGTLSSLNTLIGFAKVKGMAEDLSYRNEIEDSRGAIKARIELIKGLNLTGLGLNSGFKRCLGVISAAKGASYVLPRIISNVAFGALFFNFSANVFLRMDFYEEERLRSKLNKAPDLASKLKILQEKARVDLGQVYKKLLGSSKLEKVHKKLISEALRAGKKSLKAMLKEVGMDLPSDKKLEEVVYKLVKGSFVNKDPEDLTLVLMGLRVKAGKIALKKEEKLKRAIGLAALKELGKVFSENKNLTSRVEKGNEKAIEIGKALMGRIEESMNSSRKKHVIMMLIFSFVLIGMLAGQALIPGVGVIGASTMALISSLLFLAMDIYFLNQSYKSGDPSPHDKKMLLLSTAICLASIATMVTLGITGVIPMGTYAMSVFIGFTAIWLAQNGVSWAVINRNLKRHKETHPTLEILLEALNSNEAKEHIDKMLDYMPNDVKESLKNAPDLKEALIAAIKRAQQIQELSLEQLRNRLTRAMSAV